MGISKKKMGTWKVEVNGRQALTVRLPVEKSKLWEREGFKLYFEHHGKVHLGYKGIYFLTVPRSALRPDTKQQIAFVDDAQPEDNGGWVMVNEYTNMLSEL
jgi:hypothetical protein